MKKTILSTGELAFQAGINKETIRFYEKKKLLPEPQRTPSGYRQYTQKDLKRLLFIKNAKELGFSLSEISELLSLADGAIYKCTDVRKIAEKKLEYINQQIKQLNKLKKSLSKLIIECQKTKKISNCPIIESLSQGGK
ncbi:MAG: MerR family transcriptional regulator [FCB group bacterium]|nr:MerR family transcriptional regulator [FCB group bacterium]